MDLSKLIESAKLRGGRTATLNGRVLFENRGIQTIATDSNIHPIVKCLGFTYIRDARPGDKVKLFYRINERGGLWYGRRVE